MLRRILKKTLIWSGIIVLVLTVLGLLFIGEENWRGKRAWEAYRVDAEKRGVKLFIKDFIPPDVPDSENYAAIPVIREIFQKQPDGTLTPNPFTLPKGKKPEWPNDIKERRFDSTKWRDYFLEGKQPPERNSNAANELLHALEKYEPALQQLRDASSRPKCKFQTRWQDVPATPLPHLTLLQGAARIFYIRVEAELALNNSAAAYAELHHLLRLYTALGSEASLIAGLTRVSILSMYEANVWSGLLAERWTTEQLNAIENTLAQLRGFDDARFTFSTERGFVNTSSLNTKNQSAKKLEEMANMYDIFDTNPHEHSFREWLFWRTFPRGWIFHLMIRENEYLDWLIAPLDDLSNGKHLKVLRPLETTEDWVAAHPRRFVLKTLGLSLPDQSLFVFDTARTKYLYSYTRAQETRLACTLERFRRKNGSFPEKLDELVPAFIDAVPTDVFDGKPLRYLRSDNSGYDLWSIGPDRKDNGGRIDPKKEGDQQDDWIWHMPGWSEAP